MFAQTDVCVEPVLSINEAAQHPHFQQRKAVFDVTLADGKVVPQFSAINAFGGPIEPLRPGARLGEHNEEVLKGLGFCEDQIQDLMRSR